MRSALTLLIALAISTPGLAQGTSALKHHDTNAPVDFDAARIEVLDKANQAILSGAVKVRQGDLDLAAEQIKVFYESKGGDRVVKRMDASGGVRLTSPSETATGQLGIYDVERRLVTVTGGVVLTQGGSVLRGERLAIDLDSGRSTLDGRGGAAAPDRAGQPSGRVTGHFVVPERTPAR